MGMSATGYRQLRPVPAYWGGAQGYSPRMKGDEPGFEEAMANIGRNEKTARGYLDRLAPKHDPVFDLPLAEPHLVREKPHLKAPGTTHCSAVARIEEDSVGGYDKPSLVLRYQVPCLLGQDTGVPTSRRCKESF